MAGLTTSYYTLNGEIIGESSGGVRLDYLTDALGSVTATVNQSAAIVQKARYKPYGTLLSGTQFKMGWVGTLGYRTTSTIKSADVYVRARTYSSKLGQWITRDPLWPAESASAYVGGMVITSVDSTGLHKDEGFHCNTDRPGSDVYASTSRCSGPLAPPALPCLPSGSFPGGPPPPYMGCLKKGIDANCSSLSIDKVDLLNALRCVGFAEGNDRMKHKNEPPWGVFQIGLRGKACEKRFPNWRTDPCDNAKCAAYLMCDCMKRGNGTIGGCGHLGNYKGGPRDYLLFDTIDSPDNPKFCDCMVGCGYAGGKSI